MPKPPPDRPCYGCNGTGTKVDRLPNGKTRMRTCNMCGGTGRQR